MTAFQFTNNAVAALQDAINAAATTLSVEPGQGDLFPTPVADAKVFRATLSFSGLNEIVTVTARVGDTFTVVRGQERTTAQSWAAGSTVELLVTADVLASFVQYESNSDYTLVFGLTGDTEVTLPEEGTLATLDGEETLENKTIGIVGLNETYNAVVIVGGALTIDLRLGTVFNVLSNANITSFSVIGVTESKASSFTLFVESNGTEYTQAWGANVIWDNGTAPTLTAVNGKVSVLSFITNNGGDYFYGFIPGYSFTPPT